MELLVTGGWMDDSGECWIERVWPGGRERALTFMPPTEHRVPRKGFTGAARVDGATLVCAFDAVWRFDAAWRCAGRLHQPHFNDLHGVTVDHRGGCIWIVNTGLDSVEVVGLDGAFRGRCGLTPAWFEARKQSGETFSREELPTALSAGWYPTRPIRSEPLVGSYYEGEVGQPFQRRKVRDYLHANHVAFTAAGEPIVTLMACGEFRSLRTFGAVARVAGHPHDGVVRNDGLWFTTIDGRIWCLGSSGEAEPFIDSAAYGHVGWCRGLVVEDDWLAVAITQLAGPTQFPWRPDPPERTESSVLWFDRRTRGLVGRVELTDTVRVAKVFAMLRWSEP